MTYLRYKPQPSDSINMYGGYATDPRFLSTKAEADAIAKESGGSEPYLASGYGTIPGPNDAAAQRFVWLVDILGYPRGIFTASQLIAGKFDFYTLDKKGNMVAPAGEWVGPTYYYDDPSIDPWRIKPGTVVAL